MAISKLSIVKFLELALTIACLALHYHSMVFDLHLELLTSGTFCGYAIILIGGFVGHLMSTPINKKIDVFFCVVGCAAFIATGALNIKHFDDYGKSDVKNYGLAKGSLSIINGAIFLADCLFVWRGDY